MDLAKTLIRTASRSFYEPDFVLIIDAILLHSALRDDDLALLMGTQAKPLRKQIAKLRDDGIVSVQSRSEIREGSTRPFQKDYYFINLHKAIDVIKYKLKSMEKRIDEKYGQKLEEKKDLLCPRCKNQYTLLEAQSSIDFETGEFMCQNCGSLLQSNKTGDDSTSHAGHETQNRLNTQLNAFLQIMKQIDDTQVPENDFETAFSNMLPVVRDERLNPAQQTHAASTAATLASVRGLKQEDEKVEVAMADTSAEARRREEAIKAEEKAKKASQNLLPSWHRVSTVTGQQFNGNGESQEDGKAAAAPIKSEGDSKPSVKAEESDEEADNGEQKDAIDDFFREMANEQAEQSEDDEDESEDEESTEIETPQKKRVKFENGADTPGATSADSDADE